MKRVNFEVTQMVLETGNWFYRVNRAQKSVGESQWVISRYPLGEPTIPTLGSVWTQYGWKPMLNNDFEIAHLSGIELRQCDIFL